MLIPIADRLKKVNMQIITMPVPAQDGITRDNVTVRVDAVIYSRLRIRCVWLSFMGGAQGLRNTRGHGLSLQTVEQEAMEALATASLLMRALDRAEKRLPQKRSKPPIQKLPAGIGGAASR